MSHMVAEPSTTGLVDTTTVVEAFKTYSEWCTQLVAVMTDAVEHFAALSQLTSRMSAIMKFWCRLQFINTVVDVPVVAQRQIPTDQIVQKTVEIPQLDVVEKIVETPDVPGHANLCEFKHNRADS